MARPRGVPLEKVTLNLHAGDKEILRKFWHAKGWSVAAREIIHNACKKLEELDSQQVLSGGPKLDIEVGDTLLVFDAKEGLTLGDTDHENKD